MINLELENSHFEPQLNKNFLPTPEGKKRIPYILSGNTYYQGGKKVLYYYYFLNFINKNLQKFI